MSIYSVNRTGSMALAQVAANESYTSEDFGRILYETQVNDMAFFEAVLACDLNEIKGLREGTLLESEVTALNEASAKELVGKLCDTLKKWWAKLKGALTDAINKLGVWATKNGKSLAKQVREADFSNWKNSVPNVATYDYNNEKLATLKSDMKDRLFKSVVDKDVVTQAIAGKYLGELVGINHAITTSEYTKACIDMAKRDPVELNKFNITKFADEIEKADFHIRFMKGYQKTLEKNINEWISELKAAAKDAQNATKLSAIVRAYQTIVATMCKTNIAITRADLKAKSKAVALALADNRKSVHEVAEMEARCVMDEFDMMMTENLHMDEETRAAVAELVAAC